MSDTELNIEYPEEHKVINGTDDNEFCAELLCALTDEIAGVLDALQERYPNVDRRHILAYQLQASVDVAASVAAANGFPFGALVPMFITYAAQVYKDARVEEEPMVVH